MGGQITPGHSTKFGSHTAMELKKKIVDIKLVQVNIIYYIAGHI